MSTFDITTIQNKSPIHVLIDLIALREKACHKAFKEGPLPLQSPVHPLLLASTLSLSLLKNEDYHSLLENYVLCTPLDGSRFEELLRLPPFGTEEELRAFLDIEEQYLEAIIGIALIVSLPAPPGMLNTIVEGIRKNDMYKLEDKQEWIEVKEVLKDVPIKTKLMIMNRSPRYIMELVLRHQTYGPIFEKNPSIEVITDFLKDCWQNIVNAAEPQREINKFQVILNAYTAFNPMYLFGNTLLMNGLWRGLEAIEKHKPPTENEWMYWYAKDAHSFFEFLKYGEKAHDNFIHTIQYYDLYKNSVQGQYNSILGSSDSKEAKKKALMEMRLRFSNANRLFQRASRFYEWDPDELAVRAKLLCFGQSPSEAVRRKERPIILE